MINDCASPSVKEFIKRVLKICEIISRTFSLSLPRTQAGSGLAKTAEDFQSVMSNAAGETSVSPNVAVGDNGELAPLPGAGYQLDASNQWGWITLYVVTIVVAILGNLLFIVASLCTKRTRTTGLPGLRVEQKVTG